MEFRAAALGIAALALLHTYAAGSMLWTVAHGKTSEWQLFGVVDCCDIPLPQVQTATLFMAVRLLLVAYVGRWRAVGLWQQRARAWWGSIGFVLVIMAVHALMTAGKVPFAQAIHWQFIACCCVPLSLLAPCAPALQRRLQPPHLEPIQKVHVRV